MKQSLHFLSDKSRSCHYDKVGLKDKLLMSQINDSKLHSHNLSTVKEDGSQVTTDKAFLRSRLAFIPKVFSICY